MQSWTKPQKAENTSLEISESTKQLVKKIQKSCVRTSHGQAAFNNHLAAQIIEEHFLAERIA